MVVRVSPVILVRFYPFCLDDCLASLGKLARNAVLVSTIPGFDPDPDARYGVPRLILREREGIEELVMRAIARAQGRDPVFADPATRDAAVLLMSATDRLDGDPGRMADALASADGAWLKARMLSNVLASGAVRQDPEDPAALGAPWVRDVPELRLARISAIEGVSADGMALRLHASARMIHVSAVALCLTAELYDDRDATPPKAVLRSVRARLASDPNDPAALRVAAVFGVPGLIAAAQGRLAEGGSEPQMPDLALAGPMRLIQSRIRIALQRGESPALIESLRGIIHAIHIENMAEAAAAAGRAAALDPGADLRAIQAHAAYLANDLETADAAARAVITQDPASVDGHLILGCVQLDRHRAFRAVTAFKRLLDVQPWHVQAQMGLEQARLRLGLGAEAPVTAEPGRAARLPSLGVRGVIHYIPHLAGGGGRVAVDLIAALTDRPQALLTFDDGRTTGFALRRECDAMGVPVIIVRSGANMDGVLNTANAGLVIAHYWTNPLDAPSPRLDRPVVLLSHGPNRMPPGYDGYVFLTEAHRAQHAEHPPERCHILPNGIVCERFARAQPDDKVAEPWRPREPGLQPPVRVLILSRLASPKVAGRLLPILDQLTGENVEIVVAGGGERRWWMERRLAEQPIGVDIRFIGPVANTDVPNLLAGADIGLHLTQTHRETHSIAILEMMAAGLPIVGQPRGCLQELIAHGESGFLHEDEAQIAAALRQLIRDPAKRAAFGKAARARVQAYDVVHFRARWRKFVDTQTARHRRRRATDEGRAHAGEAAGIARLFSTVWHQGDSEPPRGLFIAAPERSGGTLLTSLITATHHFGNVGELGAWPRIDLLPATSLASWMHELIDLNAGLEGRFGWRLMFERMKRLDALMRHDPAKQDWVDEHAPIAWIRLRRRDRLAQAVSRTRALATGVWSKVSDDVPPPPPYDAKAISHALAFFAREEQGWDQLFARYRVTPVMLDYNALSADPHGTVVDLMVRLGLPVDPPAVPSPALKKQADEVSLEWMERYRREHGEC